MNDKTKRSVVVIGGGAAGLFFAINAAKLKPSLNVTILEKTANLLSKVKVSGGGRCNVTHNCFDPEILSRAYPRGQKTLRWSFEQFHAKHTVEWFNERNVQLKAEADGRMFPVTDDSQTIIDCLMGEAKKYNVKICTKIRVDKIEPLQQGFKLQIHKSKPILCDLVMVATGGYNRENAYEWLKELGHSIEKPVPSLFTFNFRDKIFSALSGISVEEAEIHIEETSFTETGPVLITHWGLSGPAVLKLSAWAARELHDREYRYKIKVNWLYPLKEDDVRQKLFELKEKNHKKLVTKQDQFPFPSRLWEKFLEVASVDTGKRWAELSNKEIHTLVQELVHARYDIQGKTTYKEEFVTCGGIPLNEINPDTMESKIIPGLYFSGEVLNIDGITGGFNFQAAWTNSWLAANAVSK